MSGRDADFFAVLMFLFYCFRGKKSGIFFRGGGGRRVINSSAVQIELLTGNRPACESDFLLLVFRLQGTRESMQLEMKVPFIPFGSRSREVVLAAGESGCIFNEDLWNGRRFRSFFPCVWKPAQRSAAARMCRLVAGNFGPPIARFVNHQHYCLSNVLFINRLFSRARRPSPVFKPRRKPPSPPRGAPFGSSKEADLLGARRGLFQGLARYGFLFASCADPCGNRPASPVILQ